MFKITGNQLKSGNGGSGNQPSVPARAGEPGKCICQLFWRFLRFCHVTKTYSHTFWWQDASIWQQFLPSGAQVTAHLLPVIIYYSITILWGVQEEWIHIWLESEQVFYPHSCEIKIFISKYDNSLNWETHQVACWAWNQHKLQPNSSQLQLDLYKT